jgi:hypothetical protein
MQSAAVPVKDLRILLDVCEIAFAQLTMSDIKTEPEVN